MATMDIDSDNTTHTATDHSSTTIPSLPLKTYPIIVTQTGPLDSNHCPIYNTNKFTQSYNNSNSNTNHNNSVSDMIDIDFLNNDNDLFQDTTTDNNPLIIHHKTPHDASTRYYLTSNDPIPYFMDNNLGENDENEIWIKGETVQTEQKANDTIIYNLKNELQLNDTILIKRKLGHAPRHYYRWGHQIAYKNGIEEGECVITHINDSRYEFTVRMNSNEYVIECDKYNIIRIQREHISKLYKIISNSEKHLMAQYLRKLLPFIPWIAVMDIASYLKYNYQRNIYFNCKVFENMVKTKHLKGIQKEKQCNICTMLNPIENVQCAVCDNVFNDNGHWLGYDKCYENEILNISLKGHLMFPNDKQRHEMYAKKPFLAVIPKQERNNLCVVQKRLSIGLKNETKLYKYQMHTVLWCYYIERMVENKEKIYIGSDDLRFTNYKKISCNVY
eukprot:5414_1